MARYLMDTNVVIDYLNNRLSPTIADIIEANDLNIFVITRIELLAWKGALSAHLQLLNDFIDACNVYDLAEATILKSIQVRRDHKTKLPDALIASTAVTHDLTFITKNLDDLKKISDLTILAA